MSQGMGVGGLVKTPTVMAPICLLQFIREPSATNGFNAPCGTIVSSWEEWTSLATQCLHTASADGLHLISMLRVPESFLKVVSDITQGSRVRHDDAHIFRAVTHRRR